MLPSLCDNGGGRHTKEELTTAVKECPFKKQPCSETCVLYRPPDNPHYSFGRCKLEDLDNLNDIRNLLQEFVSLMRRLRK